MTETSLSLLERLRRQPDDAAWQRLVDLYRPLVHGWVCRAGIPVDDAEDLTQDVFAVLLRELPQFEHGARPGAFRSWLRSITVNRLRGFWRARQFRPVATGDSNFAQMLDQLANPHSALSRHWDEEHDQHVAHRLLALIERDFQPTTWQAFRRVVLNGEEPARVAADLVISVNAVWSAKSRVLRRLRQELQGLVE